MNGQKTRGVRNSASLEGTLTESANRHAQDQIMIDRLELHGLLMRCLSTAKNANDGGLVGAIEDFLNKVNQS